MTTNGILPPGLEHLAGNREIRRSGNGELGQTDFLKLMLTQIQHQDPLNPMENGEFLSQLAQFGTVNGITELQSSFDQFATSLQSNQALQASTMVGRNVLVEGDRAFWGTGETVRGAVELDAATGGLAVMITDAAGQLVRQINLGDHPAGPVSFTWDGLKDDGTTAVPGTYVITAQAIINDDVIAQRTFVEAKVDSVTLSQSGYGPLLNLPGLGSVPMSQVKEIR